MYLGVQRYQSIDNLSYFLNNFSFDIYTYVNSMVL